MADNELRLTTFHTTCWVLGLIAFVELAAVGLALGLQRPQAPEIVFSQPQIIEREVTRYQTLPAEKETVIVEKPVYLEREIATLPEGPPIQYDFDPPQKLVLTTPPIDSPIVEKLIEESRNLRIAGDTMRAMLKVEEAAKSAPDDANVLYQFAEVFSTIGLYDRAADYYQKVFELGTTGAGSLYEMAAIKLRDGIEEPEDLATKFELGMVRVYRDTTWEDGERVILTIPVSAASDLALDPSQMIRALLVEVEFYDDLDGVPTPRDEMASTMTHNWVTPPVDWRDGGEELLRVIYEIPSQSSGRSHLLGQRKYFGQVVKLFYENALLDRIASPRRLARKVEARGEELHFYPQGYIPEDFNFENPLLPPLPE